MQQHQLVDLLRRFGESPFDGQDADEIGQLLAAHKAAVLDLLRVSDGDVRLLTACVLARIDPGSAKIVLPIVVEALGNSGANRCYAAYVLSSLGEQAAPTVSSLVSLLQEGDDFTQHFAIRALGAIGPLAAAATPALIGRLRDVRTDAPLIRITNAIEAASALGAIGPAAVDAVPFLGVCVRLRGSCDCVRWMRITAAEAVWRISGDTRHALRVATAMLADEEWWLRAEAADLLRQLGRMPTI